MLSKKIEIGLATLAGLAVAVGSIAVAVVTQASSSHLFGLSDTTWAKVAGIATVIVMIGRYLQGALGSVSGTTTADSPTPPPPGEDLIPPDPAP